MDRFEFIQQSEFKRVQKSINGTANQKVTLLADMCRLNALVAVKRAGSGHLGSSLSSLDIVTRLYYKEMNTASLGWEHVDRDIYFSSKGHDVPGLYAVLFSLGQISEWAFFRLRRLGGLDGHPDVGVPGIESNSGSLGMGISKGRGMAWAKRFNGNQGQVFVMTGDGELQEGQNYEALQAGAHHHIGNLTVIMDNNKVQSDRLVDEVIGLDNLENKFKSFGWYVARCDGHDQEQLGKVFDDFRKISDSPKLLIADTLKGRGVSFMEHPRALKEGRGYYPWHAGAPSDDPYFSAHRELSMCINRQLESFGLSPLSLTVWQDETPDIQVALQGEPTSAGAAVKPVAKVSDEFVVQAYGEALFEEIPRHPDLIVLDADLAADCRIRPVELKFPQQFIECGIAEQDMVSMAGGLARQGLLPVVNSFASFLASRANEQIYNNATENTKIIYICHYAGLIPAGPGKSHQSIRDISLFAALPNCIILQPCNAVETKMVLKYAVGKTEENCMIRLVIGPSPRYIQLPEDYAFKKGQGVALTDGDKAILFSYGPVMLNEALIASEILFKQGIELKVVNMPWLNRFDTEWLSELIGSAKYLFVLEDHATVGGLADQLLRTFARKRMLSKQRFDIFGVEGFPLCGTPPEALNAHRLDGESLASRIYARINGDKPIY